MCGQIGLRFLFVFKVITIFKHMYVAKICLYTFKYTFCDQSKLY